MYITDETFVQLDRSADLRRIKFCDAAVRRLLRQRRARKARPRCQAAGLVPEEWARHFSIADGVSNPFRLTVSLVVSDVDPIGIGPSSDPPLAMGPPIGWQSFRPLPQSGCLIQPLPESADQKETAKTK